MNRERNSMKTRSRSVRFGLPAALLVVVGLPLATTGSGASATPTRVAAASLPTLVLPATIANPPAAACATSYDLYAERGTMALPAATPTTVNVFGYSTTAAAVTAPGGPTLVACAGTPVTINLYNGLTASGTAPAETTSLLFQGQPMPPDRVGIAPGATAKSYTLNVAQPGTYLYEAGLTPNAQHQTAMGLYGALVVRPASAGVPVVGQAYGATTPFDDEAVVLTSEIDPKLNNAANPAAFDMRTYTPTYSLVNGDAYPNGTLISTGPGRHVLMRYVNAGILSHSMGVLGLNQTLVANDGSPYLDARHVVAETFGPGQTTDVITTIPAAATTGSKYAVYDASLSLNNGSTTGLGGMLTFLQVGASTATGPTSAISTVATAGAPVTSITGFTGTVTSTTGTITEAHYYIDSPATPITVATTPTSGTAFTVTFTSPTTATGVHTIYLQASDANGLGAITQATATIPAPVVTDTTAPAVSGVAVNPASTTGAAPVTVTAQASDVATGGHDIASAQYSIDGGALVAMTVTKSGPGTANLQASIPAATLGGLAQGSHNVAVQSTDAATPGNTSALSAPVVLVIDRTAPTTSGVSASKNPTNGAIGFDVNTPAVRVTATATDTQSNIGGAEGFIDTVGAFGTGFQFTPADGFFNAATEVLRGDIPLTTIVQLSNGSHTISVRSKDALGNWGTTSSVALVVDKAAPAITANGVTVTPTPAVYGTTATLSVSASDSGMSGLNGGQYWFDSATPPANPTAFTGSTSPLTATMSLGTLSVGIHTVYVRVNDAAGNVSAVVSRTFTVSVQAVNDTLALTSTATNTNAAQQTNVAAPGLLFNDLPNQAGRTIRIASAPVRTTGPGTATSFTVTCQGGAGNTGASPAILGNTVCTNGAYRFTLTPTGANPAARQASKRGTYQFTYTVTLSGVTSAPATVTITVN